MVCHTVLSIRGGRGALWNTTYPTSNLKKAAFPAKPFFFKMPALPCISTSMQHAATHSRLQPLIAARRLAANGRWSKWAQEASQASAWQQLAAAGDRNWPQVAAPDSSKRVAASSRKWPQVAAPDCSKRVAASGRKWPQVAAPDCSKRVAASGRKWPLQTFPSEWPQVACKWPLQTVPSEWPQVAASGRSRLFQASGHKWPQVAAPDCSKRVATSGRKWPLQTVPSEWPQVAASGRGRKWPQVAAFGQTNFHLQSNLPATFAQSDMN